MLLRSRFLLFSLPFLVMAIPAAMAVGPPLLAADVAEVTTLVQADQAFIATNYEAGLQVASQSLTAWNQAEANEVVALFD